MGRPIHLYKGMSIKCRDRRELNSNTIKPLCQKSRQARAIGYGRKDGPDRRRTLFEQERQANNVEHENECYD